MCQYRRGHSNAPRPLFLSKGMMTPSLPEVVNRSRKERASASEGTAEDGKDFSLSSTRRRAHRVSGEKLNPWLHTVRTKNTSSLSTRSLWVLPVHRDAKADSGSFRKAQANFLTWSRKGSIASSSIREKPPVSGTGTSFRLAAKMPWCSPRHSEKRE